jgi:hypothetical protein
MEQCLMGMHVHHALPTQFNILHKHFPDEAGSVPAMIRMAKILVCKDSMHVTKPYPPHTGKSKILAELFQHLYIKYTFFWNGGYMKKSAT